MLLKCKEQLAASVWWNFKSKINISSVDKKWAQKIKPVTSLNFHRPKDRVLLTIIHVIINHKVDGNN